MSVAFACVQFFVLVNCFNIVSRRYQDFHQMMVAVNNLPHVQYNMHRHHVATSFRCDLRRCEENYPQRRVDLSNNDYLFTQGDRSSHANLIQNSKNISETAQFLIINANFRNV